MHGLVLAACISQKKCEWIERPSGSMGSTQSHCQYKVHCLSPNYSKDFTIFRALEISGEDVRTMDFKTWLKSTWFAEEAKEDLAIQTSTVKQSK